MSPPFSPCSFETLQLELLAIFSSSQTSSAGKVARLALDSS
jgi:hypothetical protein